MARSFLTLLTLLTFFLTLTGCCSFCGSSDVDCTSIISLSTPRQSASRFKCALLYDSNGAEVAFNCLSKNTQKRIPFWKFKYGFNLVEYDKNPNVKLWEVLVALKVEAVEQTDGTHATLVCVVNEKFAAKYKQSYSEFVAMVKEGEDWKLDLIATIGNRGGVFDNLDKQQREELEGKESIGQRDGGGCVLSSAPTSAKTLLGTLLPLLILFGFLAVFRRGYGLEKV